MSTAIFSHPDPLPTGDLNLDARQHSDFIDLASG